MFKTKYLLVILIIVYCLIFVRLSFLRHDHYFSQGWDLGMYDQIVWKYSQGQLAFSSYTQKLDLADRFRPILFLIVPFYKLFPSPKTLLFIQVIVLSLAAIPLYLLARLKTKHEYFSLTIVVAYLFFVGVQAIMLDDFHELAFLPVFLGWLFYFLEAKKIKGYWLAFLGALCVREYVGFYLAVIGFYILITRRGFILGLRSILIGLGFSSVVIFFIMPSLGQKEYGGFLQSRRSFSSELFYLITNPFYTLSNLVWPLVKLKTTVISVGLYLFIPLFYPPLLLLVVFQLASRFLDQSHPYRWTLYYHYSGELAVILAVSTIFGAIRIKELVGDRFKKYVFGFLAAGLLSVTLFEQLFMTVPLKLLVNKNFYQQPAFIQDINSVISLIPDDSSVVTQNSLAAHLSQRNEIYLFPNIKQADYLIADLRPHQDDYNFFGFLPDKTKALIDKLLTSKEYSLVTKKGDVYLLKRN